MPYFSFNYFNLKSFTKNDLIEDCNIRYDYITRRVKPYNKVTYELLSTTSNVSELEEKVMDCVSLYLNIKNLKADRINRLMLVLNDILYKDKNNLEAQIILLSIVYYHQLDFEIRDDISFNVSHHNDTKIIKIDLDKLKQSYIPLDIYNLPLIYYNNNQKEKALELWKKTFDKEHYDKRIDEIIKAEYGNVLDVEKTFKKELIKVIELIVFILIFLWLAL